MGGAVGVDIEVTARGWVSAERGSQELAGAWSSKMTTEHGSEKPERDGSGPGWDAGALVWKGGWVVDIGGGRVGVLVGKLDKVAAAGLYGGTLRRLSSARERAPWKSVLRRCRIGLRPSSDESLAASAVGGRLAQVYQGSG